MKTLALLGLAYLLLPPAPAAAAAREGRMDAVEVYGTTRYDEESLRARYEPRLRRWLGEEKLRNSQGRKAAAATKAALESDLQQEGGFSLVRLQKVSTSAVGQVVVVFDVVEPADAARRHPFRAQPSGRIPDPGGLLAAWNRYSEAGWELMRAGTIGADRVECPAFYCTWGAPNEELSGLQERFVEEVPAQKEALLRVLKDDSDAGKRAAALYLLAYTKDAAVVGAAVAASLQDSDERVREAAMRVFSDMAVYHRDVALPAEKVAEALDYPSVDDRTRALAAMIGLADHPVYRRFMLQSAGTQLLRLLRARNPSNHDMALTVLRILSSQDYGKDADAWDAWLQKARLAEEGAKK